MKTKDSFANFSGSKGQSLVEVLAALAVLVVVILSLVAVNTRSVYNAAFARDQALATQYAQEITEKIRLARDQLSWSVFTSGCEGPYPFLPAPFDSPLVDCYVPGSGPPLEDCSAASDICEVQVIVSWTDAHGEHKSDLTTRLSNWR